MRSSTQFFGAVVRCLLVLAFSAAFTPLFAQDTQYQYLSGTDKDHTVAWDFYCTGGRLSNKWTKIQVPSNWELQGFGTYNYGHDKEKANETGMYRHRFFAGSRKAKKVFIVFEGSMTDTKVMINGVQAGAVHQGSFYRFKYDITKLLNYNAQNLLEVTVDKTSANASVNDAERRNSDFWVFGGIYRPVYLEIVPDVFIDRVAINAKADGTFAMDVYTANTTKNDIVEARVQQLNGMPFGKPLVFKIDASKPYQQITGSFSKPKLWSAEFPNLYQVVVSIKNSKGLIHRIKQKFGFRTLELRTNDGFYVNGAKVIMKGSNRHCFWPETGRTLSHKVNLLDANLMKEMNMNAVRMSHYPPDRDFLDVCDSLGLYVLDELTGWQAKYDTLVGHKLVKELVVRDVNHPSVVFWDNGNEGGWNTQLDNDYALYDPQKRTVIHPWEHFNGTDTKHYPDYNYMLKSVASGDGVFFPTEFMHGLYDGGAGAALDDFWAQIMKHPHAGGGFIWAFLDEAVIRTDKNNVYDSDGNHAPDGIVGPHREKEASFYAIKEIWSPVYIEPAPITRDFDGKIQVENRYSFTDLSQCKFKWQLLKFPSVANKNAGALIQAGGALPAFKLAPGKKGWLNLPLPTGWSKNDAIYLTAYGPGDKELFTWSWIIPQPPANTNITVVPIAGKVTATEADSELIVACDGVKYEFDKTTGYLSKVSKAGGDISLSGGPALAGGKTSLINFSSKAVGNGYVVEAVYNGEAAYQVKWTFAPGANVKLDYTYTQPGDADYRGITFNYPEAKVTGMKWLGRGPYRVWQNRLKGQKYGVWHKDYNNIITGETWQYPEFKGYHADVKWVTIESKESPFNISIGTPGVYLQMFRPAREKDALQNNNVEPAFPQGDIGFLTNISAIGTKFQSAQVLGPQSQKSHSNGEPVTGTLYFDFIH